MPPTRDRQVKTAATLFRRKGFHATGLAEILAGILAEILAGILVAVGVPKGSPYQHFPDGKAGLARLQRAERLVS